MRLPPGTYSHSAVDYVWRCSRCAAIEQSTFGVPPGLEVPSPSRWLPDGWVSVWTPRGRDLFCPAHSVEIFVDDKLLGSEGQ